MFEEYKQEVSEKLAKILDTTKGNFATILASGAHPSLLNRIQVEYYEEMVPIQNIASIKAMDAETLLITPFDVGSIHTIANALSKASNLNSTPVVDGNNIKLMVPKMTEERRKMLVKSSKQFLEEAKIKVRGVRKDINQKIKNNKELSENEVDYFQAELQKQFDTMNKQLEEVYKSKEKDLLTI